MESANNIQIFNILPQDKWIVNEDYLRFNNQPFFSEADRYNY